MTKGSVCFPRKRRKKQHSEFYLLLLLSLFERSTLTRRPWYTCPLNKKNLNTSFPWISLRFLGNQTRKFFWIWETSYLPKQIAALWAWTLSLHSLRRWFLKKIRKIEIYYGLDRDLFRIRVDGLRGAWKIYIKDVS